MKKLILLIVLLVSIITTGCSTSKNFLTTSNSRNFMISSENLSENESLLLNLTGNRVSKYNLKNLPNDKTFDLSLVYEVYKDGEKIKDEMIFGMGFAPTDEKLEDRILAINIEDNKIRCISSGAYAFLDIEEDINTLSYHFLPINTNISVGDEIYLFQGARSENNFTTLISPKISDDEKEEYVKNNKLTVFLKLVCK